MTKILRDGTVIPSNVSTTTKEHRKDTSQNDLRLKVGTVVAMYYPENKENNRKVKIEYDVEVKDRKGDGPPDINTYRRCITSDMFGGLADYLEFTFRPNETADSKNLDPLYDEGSTVLLLCLHGDTNQGHIVGGMRKPKHQKKSSAARGHFLEFEFNGVNFEINKDGELTLTWKSQTNIKGEPQDEEAGGTWLKIDKTGSIELNDDKALQIRMDKPTSDITIQTTERDIIINAERDINVTANRDVNAVVARHVTAEVGKNATINIGGKADIAVEKDTTIKVQGKTSVYSKGKVDVKTDSDAFVTAKGNVDIKTDKDALVTAKGKAKIKAPLIELTDSSASGSDGVITGASIDPFTGVPHIDFSGITRAKK